MPNVELSEDEIVTVLTSIRAEWADIEFEMQRRKGEDESEFVFPSAIMENTQMLLGSARDKLMMYAPDEYAEISKDYELNRLKLLKEADNG